ncbi:hypothetical protein DSM112329_01157 [Paraconexibacter sp. AEG42_29]|uniref:B12-binding domain-containing protein n=1 Tax=Paraconexibacter sp. AEG42_29 TaxID=2997339 RepID=A0AAU7ARP3_9ACTN
MPDSPATATDDLLLTRSRYLAALLDADAGRAQRAIDDGIARGLPVATTYLDVLTPVMRQLGTLWEQAKISIGDEHLATAITAGVLASLSGRLPRVPAVAARPVAVLGSGPDDFHGLGARMVGDFLQAAGWRVLDLGPAAPAEAFASVAAAHGALVVAVSTSRPEQLDAVATVRQALDELERPPLMVVGGQGYADGREAVAHVGADLYAADPAQLLQQLGAVTRSR